MTNIRLNKVLWVLVSIFTLVAAVIGIVNNDIYTAKDIVSKSILPGCVSQDIMAVVGAVVLLFTGLKLRADNIKAITVGIGILSFLFYAYGVYVIERIYNPLYFVYIAICSLSFYALICSVVSLKPEVYTAIRLPEAVRRVSVAFMFFIPILFVSLWSSQLIHYIKIGEKLEFTYSIYILDLVFVMPAFTIIAIKALRKEGFGLVLAPVMFIKGFTVLLPLVIGDLMKKPFFGLVRKPGEMEFYLTLSVVFLAFAIIYISSMKHKSTSSPSAGTLVPKGE